MPAPADPRILTGEHKPSRRRSFLFPALAAAFLTFCVIAGAMWREHRKSQGQNGSSEFTVVPFTTDFGKEFSPAISPDGRTVAYVWDDGTGPPDIYLRNIDSKDSRCMSSKQDERLYPSWSHDGSRIAFLAVRGDRLAVIVHSVRDGSEKTITTVEKSVGQWTEDGSPLLGCPGPVWMPDDRTLLIEEHRAQSATGGQSDLILRRDTSK